MSWKLDGDALHFGRMSAGSGGRIGGSKAAAVGGDVVVGIGGGSVGVDDERVGQGAVEMGHNADARILLSCIAQIFLGHPVILRGKL
jgi:hypothetical protein